MPVQTTHIKMRASTVELGQEAVTAIVLQGTNLKLKMENIGAHLVLLREKHFTRNCCSLSTASLVLAWRDCADLTAALVLTFLKRS